ncbi:MAG: S8 family serine peptidase [Actinobacteria bacterium]|nr:S8 family serine peptidase [Actinomycetota bacterium]
MRPRFAIALTVVIAAQMLATAPPAPASPAEAAPTRGGRLIVTFRDEVADGAVGAAHRAARGRLRRHLEAIHSDVVAVDDVAGALATYRGRPDVVSVEVDGKVRALAPPSDNLYPLQWNLQPVGGANRGTLNWEPVHPLLQGAGVMVAIVDSGIREGGTDGFELGVVRSDIDYDFVRDDPVADDENGHGTHIAGTIAQRTDNLTGGGGGPSVAGVASKAQLLPIKVLDELGEGSTSDAAAAILYAAQQGAKVINLSLGGDYSAALCRAVARASATALVIAASGNEAEGGLVPVAYPAACPTAIGIGALRYDGSRAPYSNTGCELAATAPGGDLSAAGRLFAPRDARNGVLQETFDPASNQFGFFYDSGTSMAAAHAAGAAAVLLGVNPDLATVRRALLGSARDLGPAGPDDHYGSGALDLTDAVVAARSGNNPAPRDAVGYWMVAADGGIFSFGEAGFLGSTGDLRLNSPIVSMARTPSGQGYWLVAADGGIFSFGDAKFFGSTGAMRLNKPIVGMAATGSGQGYWLVASDGGIFAFGDAAFYGSTGGRRLNSPIVGIGTERTGRGYWLVGSDGGIFAFGEAGFFGSTGAIRLNQPIVAITPTPTGDGYWLVASDGGIFAFGDAGFFGSTGAIKLNRPIVGLAPTCYGTGYWMVASDGGIFAFGSAPFLGSTGAIALNQPIVSMEMAIDHRFSQG